MLADCCCLMFDYSSCGSMLRVFMFVGNGFWRDRELFCSERTELYCFCCVFPFESARNLRKCEVGRNLVVIFQ